MSGSRKIEGWATLDDGSRVRLSESESEALWLSVEAEEARKAEAMPTAKEAVRTMFDAFDRLRTLGWRNGCYCPKDGSQFAAIQHGSTGIFTAWYSGPDGHAHIEDCMHHPDGFLWKPINQLTEWEEEMRQKSARRTSQEIERMGRLAMS